MISLVNPIVILIAGEREFTSGMLQMSPEFLPGFWDA